MSEYLLGGLVAWVVFGFILRIGVDPIIRQEKHWLIFWCGPLVWVFELVEYVLEVKK